MAIYQYGDRVPVIGAGCYIAESAEVIGDVILGDNVYVGSGAIVRGDYGRIEIGDGSAVEEGVIIHARPQDKTVIGKRVTLGHGCIVHNATIEEGATIGMGSVVSDYSVVGKNCIVAEAALVKSKQTIPPGKIAAGVPAAIKGDVSKTQHEMWEWAKDIYTALAKEYPEKLKRID
jgi:phenylacetic acid degradation protein